ncbi:MAG: class I adenylate-forming enzyme family protein [Myxococcota bacterium]
MTSPPNMGASLAHRAALQGERTAVIVEQSGERIPYAELDRWANGLARALLACGVQPGDRVALDLPSEPLYLALYFACARLGAILVPLNSRLSAPELRFQVEDCEPRVLIARESPVADAPGVLHLTPETLREHATETAPLAEEAPGGETPQILMYTSGTTGSPRGALLPHRKTLHNTRNALRYFALSERDVVVAPVPLFHSFGLLILSVPTLFCGATLVLVDRFDATGIQDTIARHAASLFGGVPVMYQRMLRSGLRADALRSLRLAFSAGAPLAVDVIQRFCAAGTPLVQGYGQTETSILCCLDPEHALSRAGSIGRPVSPGDVVVGDASGREVPRGQRGEVLVRGPSVMLGYWRQPEATAASRVAGWHRTGDLAVMDDEGFVTLVGRRSDLYISGGENVYPAEVERTLEAFPQVAEAAVIGVPDPEWGETGRAYVVPSGESLDREALLRFAREHLAGFKLPRQVVCVERLPRTASGKVQKHLLRERMDV